MEAKPVKRDFGVLLTGVGKRYDIVSAFAQHATVVAADPNPLAPAQYAADHRYACRASMTPATCRRCRSCARATTCAPWFRSPTSTSRCSPRRAPTGSLPGFVPDPEIAAATFDKYATHELLRRYGLPSPPTVLPGEPVDQLPGHGQAALGLGSAVNIHRAADAEAAAFFVRYIEEPAMVQRLMDGPEFSIDTLSDLDGRCLNAIPRTMIESRGGRVDQGHGDRRPRAGRSRPARRRGAGHARPLHRAGVPRPRDRAGHHRRQHPLRRRLPGARCTPRCPAAPTPS